MKRTLGLFFLSLIITSCGGGSSVPGNSAEDAKTVTPVTVTSPENISLKDEVTLNATSTYLLKTYVKANINGYIKSSSIALGSKVNKGATLFVLKTKEAENLGDAINQLDPSFHFSGLNAVKSPVNGYVTQLNHQVGDYVQDGEQLAELADRNSFGFLMNLPYEYNQLLAKNSNLIIHLPDGRNLKGILRRIMPSLDSVTQTQKVLIKLNEVIAVPENLIATVKLIKNISTHPSLPKQAVLSDESQEHFWVMKMVNDSTAVKIPVKKGIETDKNIEILAPEFKGSEKILLTGNYGLADTALVKVKH